MPTGVPSMASAIRRWRRSLRRTSSAWSRSGTTRPAICAVRTTDETTYEVTPLKVDDSLYLCTPHNLVIALDAETGEERWRFDPKVPHSVNRQHLTCRGLSYHAAPASSQAQSCRQRLFMPTADARLIALDARTGEICPGFGDNGEVDLWANMPHVKRVSTTRPLRRWSRATG